MKRDEACPGSDLNGLAGFTLLELLIGLAIFSVVAVALIAAQHRAMAGAASAQTQRRFDAEISRLETRARLGVDARNLADDHDKQLSVSIRPADGSNHWVTAEIADRQGTVSSPRIHLRSQTADPGLSRP